MKPGGVIVAKFSNVARAQSPGLAGDHGAGDLAAGKNAGGLEFDFGAASGILVERDESVSGIETDADHVHLRESAHWNRVVRQRRRPQAARRIRETMERKTAGVQFAEMSGTRAILAK